MAVRKELTIPHGFSQEEITKAVKETLRLLWGYEEYPPGLFYSIINMTFQSWGERVTVDVRKEGIIKIVSESKVSTTVFDWGKNDENLQKVAKGLKYVLSTSGLAESNPEAYSKFSSLPGDYVNTFTRSRYGCCSLLAMSMIIIPAGIGVLVCAVVLSLIYP